MKKAVAFLIAILLLVLPLASCGGDTVNENTPEKEDTGIIIASPEGTQYSILLGGDLASGQKAQIKTVVDELKKEHGIEMEISLPSRNEGEEAAEAYEILVGRADRSESEAAYDALRYGEYSLSYNKESKRITAVGSTNELSLSALEYLFETYFNKETGTLAIPENLYYHHTVEYPYDKIMISGIDVREYVIVVPSLADTYSYYTALNISDYLMHKTGYILNIVDDEKAECEYEILIGDTNRDEDDLAVAPENGEYLIAAVENKIVIRGSGIYVGAGFADTVVSAINNAGGAREIDVKNIPQIPVLKSYSAPERAESVILMIGDGMGLNHIKAAQRAGLEEFVPDSFPNIGSSVTRSLSVINGDAEFTDSAAAATAMATGTKTLNGRIGKDEKGKDLQNVRELAASVGAKTAIITTDEITGGTPAGFLAHNISRYNTETIGKAIQTLIDDGEVDYCKGSVGDTLRDEVRSGIAAVAYTEAPFFMMIEEGLIDSYSHNNKLEKSLGALKRFNDAVTFVACFAVTNGDVALIVTADHETGGLVEDETAEFGYVYTTENHTNVDVGLFAIGGGTEIFDGVRTENTGIAEFMKSHYEAQ